MQLRIAQALRWTTFTEFKYKKSAYFGSVPYVCLDGPNAPVEIAGHEVNPLCLASLLEEYTEVVLTSSYLHGQPGPVDC